MDILSFEMTPFAENCYVIRDGGEAIVIDPGEANSALYDALEGYTLKSIVLTHCHIDHVGGVKDVKDRTGAPVICHREAEPMLAAVPQQGAMFGLQVPAPPPPDSYFDEGDTVTVGNVELKVVNVPGHAPGHVALIGDGYVIGGDVLFQGSIGRTDLMGGDFDTLITSIRTKLLPLPDDTVVYSGHGPATTIGRERASNPFLVGV